MSRENFDKKRAPGAGRKKGPDLKMLSIRVEANLHDDFTSNCKRLGLKKTEILTALLKKKVRELEKTGVIYESTN